MKADSAKATLYVAIFRRFNIFLLLIVSVNHIKMLNLQKTIRTVPHNIYT